MKKSKRDNIIRIGGLLFLSFILIFAINETYKNISRTPESYYKDVGIVDDFGMTIRFHRGGSRSPSTKTPVFFVKIKDNNTLFSYSQPIWNKNFDKYINQLNKGDSVRVYHKGFDEKQNTVDIIQLEKVDTVIISKDLFDKKEKVLLIWFCVLFLIIFIVMFTDKIFTE